MYSIKEFILEIIKTKEMRNLLRCLLFGNIVWGIIFALFQFVIFLGIYSDGRFNVVMLEKDYLEQSGNKLDYYAGYCFFSVNDEPDKANIIYSDNERPKFDIADNSFSRFLYLLVYVFLWILGFISILKLNEYSPEKIEVETKKTWSLISKVLCDFYRYTTALITTAISCYGIYYTVIYCCKFWLK